MKKEIKLQSPTIKNMTFIPNKYDLRGDLIVKFNTDKTYRYSDVLSWKFDLMLKHKSPEQYFHNSIKPYHSGESA